MKIYIVFFILLFITNSALAQNIPKIKTADLIKMIDTSSSPLVINFWATWCRPCVAELPILEKNVAEMNASGIKLILINLNFPNDYINLRSFVQTHEYKSQIFWLDENNLSMFFSSINKRWAGTIPATLMINNAKQYREFYGYGLAEYQIQAYLKDLIGR
ncbi:MAG: TlpA disulfide reductase family protein [Chitinophagaceae bacterium]